MRPIDDAVRFLEAIFGSFGPDAQVPDAEVAAAESRLGRPLPRALVALYQRTGRSRSLHGAHNVLVPPDRIDFGGDHLIFYEENQGVVVWGIARTLLGEDDPPVEQGQSDGHTWTFYPEFVSVSEFACAQGAWQAVQGGLPFIGVMEKYPGASTLGTAEGRTMTGSNAERACSPLGEPDLSTEGMRAWLVDGGVAVECGNAYIGLATHDARRFELACERIGVELKHWDYATLRDG